MHVLSILILAGILVLLLVYFKKRENNKFLILKYFYKEALKRGNKSEALEAGKKYYSALRKGRFTRRDEMAIQRDLSRIEYMFMNKQEDIKL